MAQQNHESICANCSNKLEAKPAISLKYYNDIDSQTLPEKWHFKLVGAYPKQMLWFRASNGLEIIFSAIGLQPSIKYSYDQLCCHVDQTGLLELEPDRRMLADIERLQLAISEFNEKEIKKAEDESKKSSVSFFSPTIKFEPVVSLSNQDLKWTQSHRLTYQAVLIEMYREPETVVEKNVPMLFLDLPSCYYRFLKEIGGFTSPGGQVVKATPNFFQYYRLYSNRAVKINEGLHRYKLPKTEEKAEKLVEKLQETFSQLKEEYVKERILCGPKVVII